MQLTMADPLSKRKKILTVWPKQTVHLRTTAGKKPFQLLWLSEGRSFSWHVNSPYKIHEISASWLTSMREKQLLRNVFCSTLVEFTRLGKCTKVQQPWTG